MMAKVIIYAFRQIATAARGILCLRQKAVLRQPLYFFQNKPPFHYSSSLTTGMITLLNGTAPGLAVDWDLLSTATLLVWSR
jgi:hypothetical protein